MSDLPIEALREDFQAALATHDTLLVVAPTGSGKSTRLPVWLSETLGGPVLVVEPRRVACRTLAGFVAEALGGEVGQAVGYRVRFEDRSGPSTRILFATTGVALRMLQRDDAWPWVAVLVDELHERSLDLDLLVARLAARDLPGPSAAKLVMTSATVDAEALAARLGAAVLEGHGRTFPVQVDYAAGPSEPSARDLEARIADAISGVIERAGDDSGDVLVFLPGKGEIARCAAALEPLARRHAFDLVPVHASLPAPRLMAAFRPSWPRRRVFLSTNVAETSVTLPGVTTVIDPGLVRATLHRAGRAALAVVPCSQASLDQRAGRAGRVRPGRCLRLFARGFRPEPHTEPEIARVALDPLVLDAAGLGLEGERFDRAPWLRPPPAFAVARAREALRRQGALDERGHLTSRGRQALALPTSPRDALLLAEAPPALAATLADLVALLEGDTDLFLPAGALPDGRREASDEAREALLRDADDEVSAQILALRRGDADRHGLHATRLAEVRRVAASLRQALGVATPPEQDRDPLPRRDALARHLLERWPQAGFVLRARAEAKRARAGADAGDGREPWANGAGDELWVRPWSPPHPRPYGAPERRAPTAGVLLGHFWLGGPGLEVRGYGRLLLPCAPALLAEAGLGEVEVAAAEPRSGPRGVEVVGRTVRRLAGVVLAEDEAPLHGEALCQAVARLVLDNRLGRFKGCADPVRDHVHLHALLVAWPEHDVAEAARGWPTDDPAAYLARQLATLGVEASADLALLEPDDLRPDLARLTGLPEATIAALREDFPRTWTHLGAQYGCEVGPQSRVVTLEPLNAAARKAPDPSPRVLPRFRGFRVRYRKASRLVDLR